MKIIQTPTIKKHAETAKAAAGLSRILRHMMAGRFGIVSGQDGERGDPKSGTDKGRHENRVSQAALKQRLARDGVSWIDMTGQWSNPPELGQKRQYFSEDSLFIVDPPSEAYVRDLAKGDPVTGRIPQFAYIYGDKGRWAVKLTSDGSVYTPSPDQDPTQTPLAGEDISKQLRVDRSKLVTDPEEELAPAELGRKPGAFSRKDGKVFWMDPHKGRGPV